ncbi:hypothetical protein P43SY_004822 [Pythium insidiosum]|uniref:glucan endo-1,3-beta-D-glucosidase n=1 Tax=Pythium insidiosum TaxID=114742 RepID=A0AAD5M5N1_PYTIN|nr:hypothetical protein P43SY_004822 [Pythium insidiosum]
MSPSTFTTSGNLARHRRRHPNLEPLRCDVPGCGRTFTSERVFERHRSSHFRKPRGPRRCTFPGCTKQFTTTGNLTRHFKRHHQNAVASYMCPSTSGSENERDASEPQCTRGEKAMEEEEEELEMSWSRSEDDDHDELRDEWATDELLSIDPLQADELSGMRRHDLGVVVLSLVLACPVVLGFISVEPVNLTGVDLEPYVRDAMLHESSMKYESAALAKVTPAVCYSPMHNMEYPLHGGGAWGLEAAMDNDFAIMKNYYAVVRTYYSNYYGRRVAPIAAKHGVKLHLGVFMTHEDWYRYQIDDVVAAMREQPETIAAVLVGNENIAPAGPYSARDVSNRITEIRNRLRAELPNAALPPIGTVQRANEWLDPALSSQMQELASNCDIIGVNIYPFFDSNYNAQYPLVILNAVWDLMAARYPVEKLRLTETGFPTAGDPPTYARNNVPSLSNSQVFYNAFVNWNPSKGGGEAFWFMFFDRRPDDDSMGVPLEKHFGFYTYDKKSKAPDYPALLSAITQAQPPTLGSSAPPAPAPAPAPTPPPTTRAPTPPPTTRAPTPPPSSVTARPVQSNVCRVRKYFYAA